MRLIVFLFAELLCLFLFGQRDFRLVEQENFWLTTGNGASLTTFSQPSISLASLGLIYGNGALRKNIDGIHNFNLYADVRSVMKMNDKIVVLGSISYNRNNYSKMAGSMLAPSEELYAFDLMEEGDENAGDKKIENFNLAGSAGWKLSDKFSVGATVDYTAGTFVKYKDLRHANTLMDLNVGAGVFLSFWCKDGIGAELRYRRQTETINFKSYGTTDKAFHTLIDYANGYGEIETYGGEGFTDDSHEVPLFNQFIGGVVQGGFYGLYGEFTYMRRNGYYGRKSQYTVSHEEHYGNYFDWHIRYQLPEHREYLCMLDFYMTAEVLTTLRTNYRKVTTPDNQSVVSYEYYQPLKVADKARRKGTLAFTGYWKEKGDIYLWNIDAGIYYIKGKQTAYLYPYILTEHYDEWCLYGNASHNFLLGNTNLLRVSANASYNKGDMKGINVGCGLKYEQHLPQSGVRPYVEINYEYTRSVGFLFKNACRNIINAEVGVTF